jgi:transposase, IS30 family
MGVHYSHIDLAERRQIQDLVVAGVPVAVIARQLGRHRSTVHREIERNFHHTSFRDRWGKDYRGYYCLTADDTVRKRRCRQAKLSRRVALREPVVAILRAGWSPQQIAGRLKLEPCAVGTVSHETIYQFVYGPEGSGGSARAAVRDAGDGPAPAAATLRSQTARPVSRRALDRTTAGGGGGPRGVRALGRRSGHLCPHHRNGQSHLLDRAAEASRASAPQPGPPLNAGDGKGRGVLGALPPAARKPVTFDRGTEFAAWHTLRAAEGYFCDPHSPWRKGGVENASGRIRRHLPLASAAEVFAAHLAVNPSEASSPKRDNERSIQRTIGGTQ